MILFPEIVIEVLILGSLLLTGLSGLGLAVLFALDWKHRRIW